MPISSGSSWPQHADARSHLQQARPAHAQCVQQELHADARSWRLSFSVPKRLARYLASKGSIAVDGISLTINEVDGRRFGVNIIPHTMSHTTLGERRIGDHVNIEVDLVARYLARIAGYE